MVHIRAKIVANNPFLASRDPPTLSISRRLDFTLLLRIILHDLVLDIVSSNLEVFNFHSQLLAIVLIFDLLLLLQHFVPLFVVELFSFFNDNEFLHV